MNKLDWIKDLARAEQQMEDSGIIDLSSGFNADAVLDEETRHFMDDLKSGLIEVASTFNQLRGGQFGQVKIYGISGSQTDFMMFRNGFKLIFSVQMAGKVGIAFNTMKPSYPMSSQNQQGEASQNAIDLLEAQWGPFGELRWTYKSQPIKLDFLIRYYMTRFIKESTK